MLIKVLNQAGLKDWEVEELVYPLPQYILRTKAIRGKLSYTYQPFFNLRNAFKEGKRQWGCLSEMKSKEFNFDLNHPIDMMALPSYDGSVNIIFNDNNNVPRLINSRFTVRGNDTYERVDRLGENDTNIYDENKFQLLTSLLKLYNLIPLVKYEGEQTSGNLKVGNYIFYFSYCDADGNETDIVAESGIVTIFKGLNKAPFSIEGGFRDENSFKSVSLSLSNVDLEYSYIKVAYIRYSADQNEHRTANAYKIIKKYPNRNGKCVIIINGFEDVLEISENEINTLYVNINKAVTLEAVLNRLFLGNNSITTPEYKDLLDISLRILPTYTKTKRELLIGNVNHNYQDITNILNNYEYYCTENIYNYTGYAPNEIYRVGIVYILNDNSLSSVFNIRGKNGIPEWQSGLKYEDYTKADQYKDGVYSYSPAPFTDDTRNYINNIDEYTSEFIGGNNHENAKGVIRIEDDDSLDIYGLRFVINDDIIEALNKYGVKGFFFVRLSRMPLQLGQALSLPMESNTHLPGIPVENKNNGNIMIMESIMNSSREIVHDYESRLLRIKNPELQLCALIFPEYEIDLPYYNSILTGGLFTVEEAHFNNINKYLKNDPADLRHYILEYGELADKKSYRANLILVADNVKMVGIKDFIFRARAGEAEEGFRYLKPANVIFDSMLAYQKLHPKPSNSNLIDKLTWAAKAKKDASNADTDESTNSVNYLRGSYGPYVGMTSGTYIRSGRILNIYIPGYSYARIGEYFSIRYNDTSEYNAISPRYPLTSDNFDGVIYRGDSYICNFTHRLNRNFNDPAAPTNDTIVNKNTWKELFETKDGVVDKAKFEKINLGDLNAVRLGSWITFKVRSTRNLSLRSLDSSYADESFMFGHPRSFYPLSPMTTEGNYKLPESAVYNDSFSNNLGVKSYYNLPDVPYFKNSFQTRIYYSDLYINDSFINGFRRILATSYRDYDTLYGSITKIVSLGRDLICIFEHGIAKLSINQQTAISQNAEEPIFINSHNVLPENMIIYSDTIGSLWKDSIIKTEAYVYGVDTISKKIWRINNQGLEVISDNTVQQFLNNNITLSEKEFEPEIGIRNVKTHYFRNKGDVMFTYYDDLDKNSERAWNLCWNEKLKKWITFYSWIPSFSDNIYNTFFSFDREESKYKTGNNWFWAHGKTGIFDKLYNPGDFNAMDHSTLKPTYWYGKQHPFEFEFVVNDHIDSHKIFNDLEIISNNAEPESFHYEIVGDSFSFSNDKENMFIRLEATKELYLYNNFDIVYNPDYIKYKEYHRPLSNDSSAYDKSTLFPLYYSRQDRLNTVEDYYHLKDDVNTKDFSMLAGTELTVDPRSHEFHIWNHAKGVNLKQTNRLRGNMHYKEDKWYVLINPINLVLKNETEWPNNKIPIELGLSPIPNEILELGSLNIPEDSIGLENRAVTSWNWEESENSEVKVKDKWVKVRIRYTGDKLAIIHSVQTLYNITTS